MIRIRAEALDQAREMHGFSSDEKLAAALGLSSTSVRNWHGALICLASTVGAGVHLQ